MLWLSIAWVWNTLTCNFVLLKCYQYSIKWQQHDNLKEQIEITTLEEVECQISYSVPLNQINSYFTYKRKLIGITEVKTETILFTDACLVGKSVLLLLATPRFKSPKLHAWPSWVILSAQAGLLIWLGPGATPGWV